MHVNRDEGNHRKKHLLLYDEEDVLLARTRASVAVFKKQDLDNQHTQYAGQTESFALIDGNCVAITRRPRATT